MAKFEDYVKAQEEKKSLESEIEDASLQQEERQVAPLTGWEERYKELEKHNSRQAQELGSLRKETDRYRQAFDEYILGDSTPTDEAAVDNPITSDDIYNNPDEAVKKAVDSHPAIKEAKEAKAQRERDALAAREKALRDKHGDYEAVVANPEFIDWVKADTTRIDLAVRADGYDFSAADALFSLYDADKKLTESRTRQTRAKELELATLETGMASEAPSEQTYSRYEMREHMIKARQGNVKSERYLEVHLPKYRAALAQGNVRD